MALSPDTTGITTQHMRAIRGVCVAHNVFLLVRPSTADTARLIDQGYATKSMDIHDKSSDWGPHAGFVPCDPAFSKSLVGTPDPNIQPPASHGEAHAVHLTLTESLANSPLRMVPIKAPVGSSAGFNVRYVVARGQVVLKGGYAKSKAFKLEKRGDEWAVFWLDDSNSNKPVPLYVWGYRVGGAIKPVTGDYDLWMVAPHVSEWSKHSRNITVENAHGASGATLYINHVLDELNGACGRSDNPVFNHGAESQNYGFTQAIDPRLVMFTPGGGVRMVERAKAPQLLADMYRAGYLVYWNKRYGEADPHLAGKALPAVTDPSYRTKMKSVAEIKSFFNDLLASIDVAKTNEMQGPMGGMLELWREHDLPNGWWGWESHEDAVERLKLQKILQDAMVKLSSPNPPENLTDWFNRVLNAIAPLLSRRFGTKSTLTFTAYPGTGIFGARRAPAPGGRIAELIKKMGLQ